MSQLLSGDPKNQNIPGLDAILRGEIVRKDTLIGQLVSQNKMLMGGKERQDVEMAAQQETLEVSERDFCEGKSTLLIITYVPRGCWFRSCRRVEGLTDHCVACLG